MEREPYLKEIVSAVRIKEIEIDNFACAAITLDNETATILIHKRKFNSLFSEEKLSVLAHEFGHLALGHLSARAYPETDRYIASLAQDLPLNEGLSATYQLPSWFVTAEKLGLPPGLSTAQYIPLLSSIGAKRLSKIVKIPNVSVTIDVVKNQKIVKSIVDKVKINPHLVITNHSYNEGSKSSKKH
jgi:hypothetical protein